MKWKLWLSNLSVSGSRVTVRAQLPFPLRALLAITAVALAFLAGLLTHVVAGGWGRPGGASAPDVEHWRTQLAKATAERDRQAAAAVNWENRLKVDRSVQEQVAVQIKMLEDENARLTGDLAFFESLLPTPANAKGVVIRSFRVQPDGEPNSMRYRLLVQQNDKPVRDFVGDVTLVVNLQQAGRPSVLELPDPAMPSAGPGPLSFRHYQRLEGSFSVPAGAAVVSVLVRIRSDGETRVQQTFPI